MWIKWLTAVLGVALVQAEDNVIVDTTLGKVEGITRNLPGNTTVNAFLGMPYAQPPLGVLRFAPPEPALPWKGILKANATSKACIQAASEALKKTFFFITDLPESEDCLYLNVWSPCVKQNNLTVMVFLHSGGFYAGSASQSLYDGAMLASQNNVVIVSMNYRLSSFGTLYLDIPGALGNQLVQDQILAFKWVQDNIANFGGNPNNVVLFGHSAGGASVGFHLANSEISHLFTRGILQSGSPNLHKITKSKDEMLIQSLELAGNVSCPSEPNDDRNVILQCLQNKTTSELIANYLIPPEYFDFQFVPIRNGIEVPLNTTVVDTPEDSGKSILIGTVTSEFSAYQNIFFPGIVINSRTVITESNWSTLIESYLKLPDKRLENVCMLPYKTYKGSYNASQVRKETGQFISDYFIVCPSLLYTINYASSSQNVFMYSYQHMLTKRKAPEPRWAGVEHGDELPYLFGLPLYPENGFTEEERNLSKTVMEYFTQFAKTGNPNGADRNMTYWPKFQLTDRRYMVLDFVTKVKSGLKGIQCEFWNYIYPDLLSIQEDLTSSGTSV